MSPLVHARFCEALRNASQQLEANRLQQVLLIGPGITDPIDCILDTLHPTRLVVIEIDANAVQSLKGRWIDPRVHVVLGDASTLLFSAEELYDFVIVRHPDIERFPERWREVFAALKFRLHEDSVLLISAYSVSEVDELRDCMTELDIAVQTSRELTSLPVDLQGNDRYFLLGQKDRVG